MRTHYGLSLAAMLALVAACGEEEVDRGGGSAASGGVGQGLGGTGGTGQGLTGAGGGVGASGAGGSTVDLCPASDHATCASCCEEQSAGGKALFDAQVMACAAGAGIGDCNWECPGVAEGAEPDAACLENVAFSFYRVVNLTIMGGETMLPCRDDPTCAAYATCFLECAAGIEPLVLPPEGTAPQDTCVRVTNLFRSWESKVPYSRWTDGEACADAAITQDTAEGPHSSFGSCGESSQTECFGHGSATPQQVAHCVSDWWEEKYTGAQNRGHYLAMAGAYSEMACGFYQSNIAANYR